MKIVILAVQDKKTKKVHLYSGAGALSSHDTPVKDKIVEGKKTLLTYEPYPFENFMTEDVHDEDFWKHYKRMYLVVEANISQDAWNSMQAGNVRSYRFAGQVCWNGEVCHEPFAYAKKMLDAFPSLAWDMSTWTFHDKARSEAEERVVLNVYKQEIKHHYEHEHEFDLSVDKYTLKYLPELIDYANTVFKDDKYTDGITFGRYGRVNVSAKDIDKYLKLTTDLFTTLFTGNFHFHIPLIQSKQFTKEFYQSLSSEQKQLFLSEVFTDELEALKDKKFNIDKLFMQYYKHAANNTLLSVNDEFADADHYQSLMDYIADVSLSPSQEDLELLIHPSQKSEIIDEYDDYGPGYWDDYDDSYDDDYPEEIEHERIEALQDILADWPKFLDKRTMQMFNVPNVRDLLYAMYDKDLVDKWFK
jgi:hypothetical protein